MRLEVRLRSVFVGQQAEVDRRTESEGALTPSVWVEYQTEMVLMFDTSHFLSFDLFIKSRRTTNLNQSDVLEGLAAEPQVAYRSGLKR